MSPNPAPHPELGLQTLAPGPLMTAEPAYRPARASSLLLGVHPRSAFKSLRD